MSYFSVLCLAFAYYGFIIVAAKAAYGKYLERTLLMFFPEENERRIYAAICCGYFMFGFGLCGMMNECILPIHLNISLSTIVGIVFAILGFHTSRNLK